MTFIEYLMSQFGIGEPIFIKQIQYESYSRPWIFKELKKLVNSGTLKRFARGVYYFPEKMPFGEVPLNAWEMAVQHFITDGNEVYGYVAGFSLLNLSGLSTQVPNFLEVATNKESTRVRDIRIGYQRVRAHRSRTTVTKENFKTLQLLELMSIMNPADLDETEQFLLRKFVKASGATRGSIRRYVKFFPDRAAKNLILTGAIYRIQ
ncbi:MAG: DUF6088 family protein [Erysipelotrichaceae bacterium]|jgi:hypothetical protein|nr:DUF6088 family protein [Erysipelotrichaceae bacterium]